VRTKSANCTPDCQNFRVINYFEKISQGACLCVSDSIIMMQSTQHTVQVMQYEATRNNLGHLHQCLQVTPLQFGMDKQVFSSECSGFIMIQKIDIHEKDYCVETNLLTHWAQIATSAEQDWRGGEEQ